MTEENIMSNKKLTAKQKAERLKNRIEIFKTHAQLLKANTPVTFVGFSVLGQLKKDRIHCNIDVFIENQTQTRLKSCLVNRKRIRELYKHTWLNNYYPWQEALSRAKANPNIYVGLVRNRKMGKYDPMPFTYIPDCLCVLGDDVAEFYAFNQEFTADLEYVNPQDGGYTAYKMKAEWYSEDTIPTMEI